ATAAHCLDKLLKGPMIVRMDEGPWVQADELRVAIAVHPTGRRVGLDDDARLQVIDDQPVTGRLEDASVLLLPLPELSFRAATLISLGPGQAVVRLASIGPAHPDRSVASAGTSPIRTASRAAWVRDCTPSLARIWPTWL